MEKYQALVRARIRKRDFNALKRLAREEKATVSRLVREAVEAYLAVVKDGIDDGAVD